MLRVGVISAYSDEDWHSLQILEAARLRAQADELSPLDFSADVESGRPRLLVRGRPHREYACFLTPRALGDDGDQELQIELYHTLAEDGALLVNDVSALLTAIDKFKTSWLLARAGLPTPRSLVVQRLEEGVRALAELGARAVAKPLYGSLGIGVALVTREEELAACLARWKALYLQAYVDGGGSDIRAFVVGDRVEAAILRTADVGDFRTNVHQGGRVRAVSLDESTSRLAVVAAWLVGLDYAGVDVIRGPDGPTVIEVNGTPLFRGVLEATGRSMAAPIVEHALARAAIRDSRSDVTALG